MSTLWSWLFPPGLFSSSFMVDTWEGASIVAVIAGIVGFFVVLRGSAFVAHALPKGGFAGAACATFFGFNSILGLAMFSVGGALGIAWLGRRGRHDVVTALTLVFLLGTGALFLNLNNLYAPEIYSLLFGEILGITHQEVLDTAAIGVISVVLLGFLYRPLLLLSILPTTAEARGIRPRRMETVFLIVVGLATAVTVPIVGALLSFSLMIAPAAAARYWTIRPLHAMGLSAAIAVFIVALSIFLSYDTGWPVGFFVAALAAAVYALSRALHPTTRTSSKARANCS